MSKKKTRQKRKKINKVSTATIHWNDNLGRVSIDPELLDKMVEDGQRTSILDLDAIWDTLLRHFLEGYFSKNDKEVNKLFDSNIGGPLVSLIQKARLLYALGFINKTTLQGLTNIHNIRNRFAHDFKVRFEEKVIVDLVKELFPNEKKNITENNSYEYFEKAVKKVIINLNKNLAEAFADEYVNKRIRKNIEKREYKQTLKKIE